MSDINNSGCGLGEGTHYERAELKRKDEALKRIADGIEELEKRIKILELKEEARRNSVLYGLYLKIGLINQSDQIMCKSMQIDKEIESLEGQKGA
jgi:hypothetical protein